MRSFVSTIGIGFGMALSGALTASARESSALVVPRVGLSRVARASAAPSHPDSRRAPLVEELPRASFLTAYLEPRLLRRLDALGNGIRIGALQPSRTSLFDPWDGALVESARRRSLSALRGAAKDWLYDVSGLGSVAIGVGPRSDSGDAAARIRVGIAHALPRLETVWDRSEASFALGIDARGGVTLDIGRAGPAPSRWSFAGSPQKRRIDVLFGASF